MANSVEMKRSKWEGSVLLSNIGIAHSKKLRNTDRTKDLVNEQNPPGVLQSGVRFKKQYFLTIFELVWYSAFFLSIKLKPGSSLLHVSAWRSGYPHS